MSKKRQDDDEKERSLSGLAKAVLVAGAGTAIALRKGGDVLSKQLPMFRRALIKTTENFDKRSLHEMRGTGLEDIKRFSNMFRDNLEATDDIIELNTRKRGSLLNILRQRNILNENKEKFAEKNITNGLIRSLYREQLEKIEGIDFNDKNITQRTNEIIDNLITRAQESINNIDPDTGFAEFTDDFKDLVFDTYGENSAKALESFTLMNKDALSILRDNKEQGIKDIDRVINKLNDFDELKEKFSPKSQPFFTKLMNGLGGTRTATIDDILKHSDKIDDKVLSKIGEDPQTILEALKELRSKDSRYGNFIVDNALKVRKGELRYYGDAEEIGGKIGDFILNETAGKILKPFSFFRGRVKEDPFYFISKGTADYTLQSVAEGIYDGHLKNDYVRVLGKTYKMTKNGMTHISKLDNTYMANDHSFEASQLREISGDVDRYKTPANGILGKLGLFSKPHVTKREKIARVLTKNASVSTYNELMGDIGFNELSKDLSDSEDHIKKSAGDFLIHTKRLIEEIDNNTETVSNKTLKKLSKSLKNDHVTALYEAAFNNESIEEYINSLSKDDVKKLRNKDLASLVNSYKLNPSKAVASKKYKTSYGEIYNNSILDYNKSTKALSFFEQVQREITKEGLIVASNEAHFYESVYKTIKGLDVSPNESKHLKQFFHMSMLSDVSEIGLRHPGSKQAFRIMDQYQRTRDLFIGNDSSPMKDDFNESVKSISQKAAKRRKLTDESAKRLKMQTVTATRPNQSIHVKKGINLLDILKNMNDTTMLKAGVKQYYAGRNNMEDVTAATMFPYFILNRLSKDLTKVGLNLPHTDNGSIVDLAKNIFFKRALPIYAGLTTLSYLDYETKNFTGTSLKGAAANSIANTQLGLKTFTDIFQGPLKDMHYWITPFNYKDEHEYKTKEEYKEFLETGYEPVRKGKNWLLGQSEFIGGKVSFYQPNFVKRANSDWYDEGVYGGSDEKWKHSIIPTPRHPLSTLRYLVDPYWLERKHKYDRPYPVSGPMFDPQTPWGVIGNATIGKAIKPQKKLGKEFLTKNYVDIRSIIADNNEYIKNKARGKYNTVSIKSSDTYMETDNIGMDSPYHERGLFGFDKYTSNVTTTGGGGGGFFGLGGGDSKGYVISKRDSSRSNQIDDAEISTADKMGIIASGGAYDRQKVLKEIEQINMGIKIRSRLSYGYDSNFAKEMQSNNTPDVNDLLRSQMVASDLLNSSSTSETIADARYSVKELSGIYSFISDSIMKPSKRYTLANSNAMYAGTRRFWESGNEGYDKGGVMEIVRRFIPHEDRSRIRLNPLRNNMPNWLPSRFRTGDPYALLKKGEMRLPGRGYEDINKDQKIINETVGPSVISGSKEDILSYLINGSGTTNKKLNDIMDEGTELHEKYEKYLLDSGVAVSIEGQIDDKKNNIKGFYDVKIKDSTAKEGVAIMDIKTVGSKVFDQIKTEGVNSKHMAQVNYYLGLMGLSKGYVHYIDRDNESRMVTYDFNFSQSLYNQTLQNLKDARAELANMVKKHRISPYEMYSDFQKFKILADIAPGSDEYKQYRKIVQANLREDQQKEYDEILERVEEQSKNHRFFNYKFVGFKGDSRKGVVESVSNKGIKLLNDATVYKLAGLEDIENKVTNYIKPGVEIRLEFDRLDKERKNINAIVFQKGINVNREMIKSKDAERKEDGSAIGTRAGLTSTQILLGKPIEAISHLPIPYFHNKFLKVDTPYESWLNENVYGSKYQSWEHPIKTMIKPSFRKDMGSSYTRAMIGTGLFMANEYLKREGTDDLLKWGVDKAFKLVTPGAFTGFMVNGVLRLNWSDEKTQWGSRIGATIGLGGFLLHNAQNPLLSVSSGAALGYSVGDWLLKGMGTKGAAIGAGVGLAITGIKTDFNFKKMGAKWIPKETEKRWEIEEYFDRLKYLKYKGLYEKAAALAQRKDGVNIRGIINQQERKEKSFTKELAETVKLKHIFNSSDLKDTESGNYYNKVINDRLNTLLYGDKEVPATKYVRAALAYKQAMESTVYALNKDSSYTQILRSLEKYERDYFLEFMKETDPKEQKRILKTIAPNKRKILQMAWGKKVDENESNEKYFKSHKLPGITWNGWSNRTDLEQIKMKTITNEGMLLSDFGYYDSSEDTPQYKQAQALDYDKGTGFIIERANLLTALNGLGLFKSEVSIDQTEQEGVEVVFNLGKIANHKIKTLATSALSNFY